jgi:hypothetical protein
MEAHTHDADINLSSACLQKTSAIALTNTTTTPKECGCKWCVPFLINFLNLLYGVLPMKHVILYCSLLITYCSLLVAQDTTCNIIWHEPIVLANEYGIPSIAAQGDTVHITWYGDGPSKLPYLRSTTEGSQWDSLRDLFLFPDTSSLGWATIVKTSNKYVYLFCEIPTGEESDNRLYMLKSSNRGSSWDSIRPITNFFAFYQAEAAVQGDTIVIPFQYERPSGTSWPHIMASTNAGVSWNVTPESLGVVGLRGAFGSTQLHMTNHPTYLFLNAAEIEYRTSTDLGFTWTKTEIISDNDGIFSNYAKLAANKDNVFIMWREAKICNEASCLVFSRRSENEGEDFLDEENISEGTLGFPQSVAMKGDMLAVGWDQPRFGGGFGPVVRVSFNVGKTWCPASVSGAAWDGNIRVAISTNAIHAVYSNSAQDKIYYRRGEIIRPSSVVTNEGAPNEMELLQNYPNPFNPKTAIGFSLLADGEISLRVFDIYGKEVATLIHSRKMDEGMHSVEWDAENFPSGMYFYRLNVTDTKGKVFSQTKKMLLLK